MYSITLSNNTKIPILGLGTWSLSGDEVSAAVEKALKMGYTHIDTAENYDNEAEIGEVIQGFDRKKLFITSKVWYEHLDYYDVINACKKSLKNLKTDYLNLYLIHWPNPAGWDMKATFEALKKLYSDGIIKGVGVSNFVKKHLDQAIPICNSLKLPILVNQVEFHPFLYQKELFNYCKSFDIHIVAYCPIARGLILNEKTINYMALKYQKSPAQISLKWLVQKNIIAIPRSTSEKHLQENIDIFDFEIADLDIKKIDAVNQNKRVAPVDFSDFDD
jgi:diketogulonate reductase-like aldo/keto reductase